jgi:hypothetical protein
MGTVTQLFNFGVFLCSLVLFLNNLYDFQYKRSLITDIDDNIPVFHDLTLLFASFYVMYGSIVTPFEVSTRRQFGYRPESLPNVLYFTALLYSSVTTVLDDPSVLISRTFEAFSVAIPSDQVGGIDVAVVAGQLAFDDVTFFSFWIIQVTNISKAYIMIAGLVYGVG